MWLYVFLVSVSLLCLFLSNKEYMLTELHLNTVVLTVALLYSSPVGEELGWTVNLHGGSAFHLLCQSKRSSSPKSSRCLSIIQPTQCRSTPVTPACSLLSDQRWNWTVHSQMTCSGCETAAQPFENCLSHERVAQIGLHVQLFTPVLQLWLTVTATVSSLCHWMQGKRWRACIPPWSYLESLSQQVQLVYWFLCMRSCRGCLILIILKPSFGSFPVFPAPSLHLNTWNDPPLRACGSVC